MIITNNNSNINFGSIYKYNVTNTNLKAALSAQSKISNLEFKDSKNYSAFEDFVPYNEMVKTGVIQNIHIAAADKYDKFIESVLRKHKIDYVKESFENVTRPENIFNRIVLPEHATNKILAALDTEKIENLFKQDNGFYISQNGENGSIGNRYKNVQNYIRTGRNINATEISLKEENGKPVLNILDGRHRFAVMRDMGMKKIKFALDANSLQIAYKYNLI